MLQNQIKELQREREESEAVEKFIMKKVSAGCSYEDLLKAHYREGSVVNGEWVDEVDEEDYIADCSRCYYRFYEMAQQRTVGREFITLICDCGPICKTCLTEKERGQLEEWDEEDWDTELLCQDVEGFRCCVCESVMVTVTKKYNQLNVGEDETE